MNKQEKHLHEISRRALEGTGFTAELPTQP